MRAYACFIDVRKALPNVYKKGLWCKVHDMGATGKIWRVLHDMYEGGTAHITVREGVMSGEYRAENGVREGLVLSPTLFIIFINGLINELEEAGLGVYIDEA
jgi:hypothetical protein